MSTASEYLCLIFGVNAVSIVFKVVFEVLSTVVQTRTTSAEHVSEA